MTVSTSVAGTDTINEHTCTGTRIGILIEGNLDGCKISLKQRKNLTGVDSGFDDPDGNNIRGSGFRHLAVLTGQVVFPQFDGGKRNGNISVEIIDE